MSDYGLQAKKICCATLNLSKICALYESHFGQFSVQISAHNIKTLQSSPYTKDQK